MPPSSRFVVALRPTTWRPVASTLRRPWCNPILVKRGISESEKPLPKADQGGKGPNQEQLPHVTEEAEATSKIMGEELKPEAEEQGTPVEEVLKRDGGEAKKNAPQVVQQAMDKPPKGSRPYSTTARRPVGLQTNPQSTDDVVVNYRNTDDGLLNHQSTELGDRGHVYDLPNLPLPRNMNLKRREDPVVDQVTKLILKSGRLSRAQRTTAMILERLRTAPPPKSDPAKPLIPGAPPVSHLPLNPIHYMTLAIDSAAPLFRIKSLKGAAGGGAALQIPHPLSLRQRRRVSINWVLDAASKKRSKGSGRAMFAHKVADEMIAIVEGKSSIWDKRQGIHKLGVAARANLATYQRRKRFR